MQDEWEPVPCRWAPTSRLPGCDPAPALSPWEVRSALPTQGTLRCSGGTPCPIPSTKGGIGTCLSQPYGKGGLIHPESPQIPVGDCFSSAATKHVLAHPSPLHLLLLGRGKGGIVGRAGDVLAVSP